MIYCKRFYQTFTQQSLDSRIYACIWRKAATYKTSLRNSGQIYCPKPNNLLR